jgi:hypothetical protein
MTNTCTVLQVAAAAIDHCCGLRCAIASGCRRYRVIKMPNEFDTVDFRTFAALFMTLDSGRLPRASR